MLVWRGICAVVRQAFSLLSSRRIAGQAGSGLVMEARALRACLVLKRSHRGLGRHCTQSCAKAGKEAIDVKAWRDVLASRNHVLSCAAVPQKRCSAGGECRSTCGVECPRAEGAFVARSERKIMCTQPSARPAHEEKAAAETDESPRLASLARPWSACATPQARLGAHMVPAGARILGEESDRIRGPAPLDTP